MNTCLILAAAAALVAVTIATSGLGVVDVLPLQPAWLLTGVLAGLGRFVRVETLRRVGSEADG